MRASAHLFAERGYKNVSTIELGEAVGMSGPALYNYFPSKEALLCELRGSTREFWIPSWSPDITLREEVPQGAVIPPRSLVAGVPGRVRRELSDDEVAANRLNAQAYQHLIDLHRS